jgi:TolA-binding protein
MLGSQRQSTAIERIRACNAGHALVVSVGAAFCVFASGCLMTKQEGAELRTANQVSDQHIAQLEAEVRAKNLALDAKIAELQAGIERAKSLLTRDSADVGAQVQSQEQKMAELEGKLDELQHGLTDVVQQSAKTHVELDDKITKLAAAKPVAGAEAALDPAQVPEDKVAHFTAAYEAYKAGEHDKARALFREYLVRYAADDKAGDAQYWLGASFLVQSKPATALGEYRKVIAAYPKSPAVDTALYGMADAFYRLHACTDAKGAIDALLKRKPSKALGDRANELLRALTTAAKDFCTS